MERNDKDVRPPYEQHNFGQGPPYGHGNPGGMPPYDQQGFGMHPPPYYSQNVPVEKPRHTPSFVLSIIGLIFSILFPLVTYPCSIIALVQSVKYKQSHRTNAAFVMSVIALPIAVLNSIAGAIAGAMGLHPWF